MQTSTCPVKQKVATTRSTYRPRRPRRSPLYQLLEDHFEEFLLSYEERFPRHYGPLRSEITRRTVYKFLDCGILEHGFARVVCPQCKAEFLIAYSCKTRFMITLTVPKRIRPFFLWDRKLLGTLARCAAGTIRSFYRQVLQEPDGDPGIVTSIQTFGNRAANYHPHIHCLAADGLFLSDGAFRYTPFISPVDISELFRRVVLEAFVKEELITQDVAHNMLSWPHSGFHVHIGPRLLLDDGDSLGATARYAARAPISLSRLHYDRENQKATYCYTSAYDKQEHIEQLSPLELIARLATHIPDRYEHLLRYSGHYSNRSRGTRRAMVSGTETGIVDEKSPPTHWRRQWQQLLQRVFHVTLTCPTCGTEMKIISVISGSEPVDKILSHLRDKGIDARAGPFADQAA